MSVEGNQIDQTKVELRQKLLSRRRSLDPATINQGLATAFTSNVLSLIADLPRGDITCFVSMGTEPPTQHLRAELKSLGFRVLLPRVEGRELAWVVDRDGMTFTKSAFGVSEPDGIALGVSETVLPQCVAVLVPALAIDQHGYRIGYGKGFYDRALSFTRGAGSRGATLGPLLIGITYESETMNTIPTQAHDIAVDARASEFGTQVFRSKVDDQSRE